MGIIGDGSLVEIGFRQGLGIETPKRGGSKSHQAIWRRRRFPEFGVLGFTNRNNLRKVHDHGASLDVGKKLFDGEVKYVSGIFQDTQSGQTPTHGSKDVPNDTKNFCSRET